MVLSCDVDPSATAIEQAILYRVEIDSKTGEILERTASDPALLYEFVQYDAIANMIADLETLDPSSGPDSDFPTTVLEFEFSIAALEAMKHDPIAEPRSGVGEFCYSWEWQYVGTANQTKERWWIFCLCWQTCYRTGVIEYCPKTGQTRTTWGSWSCS